MVAVQNDRMWGCLWIPGGFFLSCLRIIVAMWHPKKPAGASKLGVSLSLRQERPSMSELGAAALQFVMKFGPAPYPQHSDAPTTLW